MSEVGLSKRGSIANRCYAVNNRNNDLQRTPVITSGRTYVPTLDLY